MRSELLSAGFSTELCLQWEPNTSCLILQVFWRHFIRHDFSFSLCITAKWDYCFCSSWLGDFSSGCAVQKLTRLFFEQLLKPRLFLTTSTWKSSHSLGCLNSKRFKKNSSSTMHLSHKVTVCVLQKTPKIVGDMLSFQHTQKRGENREMEVQVLKFCQTKTCFFQCNTSPRTHGKTLLGASAFVVSTFVCSVKAPFFKGVRKNHQDKYENPVIWHRGLEGISQNTRNISKKGNACLC